MYTNRWLLVVTLPCLIALQPSISAAQPVAVASNLFQQAITKMEAEQFTEACPLLEDSYRLDAKAGTLFTLANCRDRQGKYATASARYGEYLRMVTAMKDPTEQSRHVPRAAIAEARIKELTPKVPTLTIIRDEEAPPSLTIWVDNAELPTSALNSPLPLDPGEHELLVRQPGYADEKRPITLEEGRPEAIDLADFTKARTRIETPVKPLVTTNKLAPTSNPRVHKTAGFITLGVGGAGLVFGGIMGALVMAQKQTATPNCTGPEGYACNEAGFAAVGKMRTYADPSTIGFIAGGVLAATGVVLLITAPARGQEKPAAITLHVGGTPEQGFVGVRGAF